MVVVVATAATAASAPASSGGRCFATMFVRTHDPTQQGRTWPVEAALFRVFVLGLLNFTQLPLHVLHNAEAAPHGVLGGIPGARAQVHFHQVDLIHGHTSGFNRHYAHMYTKLHAWRVLAPLCGTVALVDYDVLTLRPPDGVFDACGGAPLCAVRSRYPHPPPATYTAYHLQPHLHRPTTTTPTASAARSNATYFNGGLLVLQPDAATFVRMKRTVAMEREQGRRRDDAEQSLLNEWYPAWKPLPLEYNVQGVAAGAPWSQDKSVFLHEKYWLLPPEVQGRLLPKGEGQTQPTLLDLLRSLFAHLFATIGGP